MSRIKYVVGDATNPIRDGITFVAHCLNNVGAHDAGFALAVARKWPMAKRAYRDAFEASECQPGECISCAPEMNLHVIAMIGQDGLGPRSLRHNWLGAALHYLASEAIQNNASVHMPRIGCGLAGGKWEDVEPLILAAFNTPLASFVPVTVYDLPSDPLGIR